jgi:hypothetical protein
LQTIRQRVKELENVVRAAMAQLGSIHHASATMEAALVVGKFDCI